MACDFVLCFICLRWRGIGSSKLGAAYLSVLNIAEKVEVVVKEIFTRLAHIQEPKGMPTV